MTAKSLTLALLLVAMNAACASEADDEAVAANASELNDASLDQLRKAGWDCQPRGGGAFIACGTPGLGLPPIPSLGPDGQPAYRVVTFFPNGTFRGTSHFLRADLYQGELCSYNQQPYLFLGLVGYYECFTPA